MRSGGLSESRHIPYSGNYCIDIWISREARYLKSYDNIYIKDGDDFGFLNNCFKAGW